MVLGDLIGIRFNRNSRAGEEAWEALHCKSAQCVTEAMFVLWNFKVCAMELGVRLERCSLCFGQFSSCHRGL